MKLHLNYDGKQNNGIIFNDKYTNGCLFVGVEYRPTLSFEYDSFQYSEVFEGLDYVELNKVKKVMTTEQADEIKALAVSWVQPLGQEGNPTLEQAQGFKENEITAAFNNSVTAISSALPHEMVSWRKQEDEARAYLVDVNTPTPFIDALLISRGLSELKGDLVNKIITNADAYQLAYAALLGKYQSIVKMINISATVSELDIIGW